MADPASASELIAALWEVTFDRHATAAQVSRQARRRLS
jgi:hypothetical protein